jgi:hypothetical protein
VPWLGKAISLQFSVGKKSRKRPLKPDQKVKYYKKGLLVGFEAQQQPATRSVTGLISADGIFEVKPWTSVIDVDTNTYISSPHPSPPPRNGLHSLCWGDTAMS